MFQPSRLEQLLIDNKMTKKALSEAIGISQQGLSNMFNGTDFGISRLEALADFFNVPMDYFCDRGNFKGGIGHNVSGTGNNVSGNIELHQCQQEVSHLKKMLEEKERTIQILLKQCQYMTDSSANL